MARRSGRSRVPWLVVLLAVVVPLAYVLYPVRTVLEGVGTIEPAFEDLVVVAPDVSGIVTRLRVSPRQEVEPGAALFEYVPDGQWAVLAYGRMTTPGAPAEPPPADPEWYRAGNERRIARAEALRRWTARVYASGVGPLAWEQLLQQRLNVRIPREDDLAMAEARAAENVRLGRHEANVVQVFDKGAGKYRATEDGEPVASDVAGMVYSLWITQRLQLSNVSPVAEIMKAGTPVEVLGLVPIPPAKLRGLTGWRAVLTVPGDVAPAPLAATTAELGRVPLDTADATVIFPGLPVSRDSVFVRVRLDPATPREQLGMPLRITLTSPVRPRAWYWLAGA